VRTRPVATLVTCVALALPTTVASAQAGPPVDRAPEAFGSASGTLFGQPLVPQGRVRIETDDMALPDRAQRITEDGSTMTFTDAEGQTLTLAKAGRRLEGEIRSIEDGVLVISSGSRTLRVRERDVTGIEVREPGSTSRGVVGGLLGVPVGLIVSALVCASTDCGTGALWAGVIGGGVLGAAAAGAGEWRRVPIVRHKRMSFAVKPAPRGGSVGLSLGF